jgi:hypothetical protein
MHGRSPCLSFVLLGQLAETGQDGQGRIHRDMCALHIDVGQVQRRALHRQVADDRFVQRANSAPSRPGVARISSIKVLQKTMLPAPMLATFAIFSTPSLHGWATGHKMRKPA